MLSLYVYTLEKLDTDLTQDWLPQLQDLGLNCLPLLPQYRVFVITAFATQSSNKACKSTIVTSQTLVHPIMHQYS